MRRWAVGLLLRWAHRLAHGLDLRDDHRHQVEWHARKASQHLRWGKR